MYEELVVNACMSILAGLTLVEYQSIEYCNGVSMEMIDDCSQVADPKYPRQMAEVL